MKRKLPEKFFEQNQRAKTRKWKFFNLNQALWGAGNREFRDVRSSRLNFVGPVPRRHELFTHDQNMCLTASIAARCAVSAAIMKGASISGLPDGMMPAEVL